MEKMDIYTDWKEQLPADFSPNSRVWIFQCSRRLGLAEALQAESLLEDFVANWKSHGDAVKGYANLFFGQFIVLMADEESVHIGGCSTDSSTRMIKEIETLLGVQFFDRLTMAFLRQQKVEMLPLSQLNYAIENGFITPDTLYFNNRVGTKQELLENWMTPVRNSWLAQKFQPLV